jgi:hypothetical protein
MGEERLMLAVWSLLAGDAQLNGGASGLGGRIYRDLAPPGTRYPIALLSVASSVDLDSLSGAFVWQDVVVQVKVTGRGADRTPYVPLAERVGQLLHGYVVAAEGVVVVKLRRTTSPAQPIEVVSGGEMYAHLNQQFRTEVVPAPSAA